MLPAAAYCVRQGHAGAVAGAARVRDRRVRHARAGAHRLEHLRRQHREHARGRVLVRRSRSRSRCSRSARSRTRSTPGKRRWLPAVLIAAAVMSHIVVAIFVGVAALLLWLVRRPQRTWPIAVAVGAVGVAADRGVVAAAARAAGVHAEHAVREGVLRRAARSSCRTGSSCPNPVKHTIEGIVRGVVAVDRDVDPARSFSPTLWLPWWIWVARRRRDRRRRAGTGAARRFVLLADRARLRRVLRRSGPSTRCGTRGSCRSGCSRGASSPRWARPRSLRLVGVRRGTWAYTWITRRRSRKTRAPARGPTSRVDDERRRRSRAAPATRSRCSPTGSFDAGPPGWEPPPHLDAERARAAHARAIATIALAVLVARRAASSACAARGARATATRASAIAGWAAVQLRRLPEPSPRGPSSDAIMTTMDSAAAGTRALWEGGDARRRVRHDARARAAPVLHERAASARWKACTSSRRRRCRSTSSR